MPEQLTLAPYHDGDPEESKQAARKVNAARQYALVLCALLRAEERGWGAQTDDEIAEMCDLMRHSAGTRRGVAVRQGHIERAGIGTTPRGNQCATWRLTEAGRAEARRLMENAA